MWRNLYNRVRWGGVIRRLYREFYQADPLFLTYPGYVSVELMTIGDINTVPRQKGLLVIQESGISVYINREEDAPVFHCSPDELRWFGRPVKYNPGHNEMWLHVEVAGRWQWLKLWLWQTQMVRLVRAMKQIATPEQVKAYRRRRPYIHYGPVLTEPATQEITGEWLLEPPVTLYLTPSHLVILDSVHVLRTIPLEIVQRIGALHRLDAPQANGLARFQVEGETMAFSLHDHTTLAEALAEAAKRTLEEPVLQKRKSKDDDWWDEIE